MTLDAERIPVEGYPGDQRRRTCDECSDGVYEIKDTIWSTKWKKLVSMRCTACGDIIVKTREWRMFRWRLTIRK